MSSSMSTGVDTIGIQNLDAPGTARAVRSVHEALFAKGILVDMDFRAWTATSAVKKEDLGLPSIPEGMTLGRLALLPKELISRPTSIHAMARRAVDEMTFPFLMSHARYSPMDHVQIVNEALKRYKVQFDEAVAAINDQYVDARSDEIGVWKGKVRKHFPDVDLTLFEARITKAYPPADKIIKLYRFGWNFYEVQAPHNIRIQAFNDEARERLEKSMGDWVSDCMGAIRGRVVEVAEHMAAAMNGKKDETPGLPEKSKKSILKQIEVIETLNFLGDKETTRMLEELKTNVENDWASKARILAVVQSVGNAAREEFDEARVGVMRELTGQGQRIVEV